MNKQRSIWTAWLALALGVGVVPFAHATSTWQFTGPTGAARTVEEGQAEAVYGVRMTGMQGVYAANGGHPSTTQPASVSNPFGSIHKGINTTTNADTWYSINGFQSGATWQTLGTPSTPGGMTFEPGKGLGMSSDGSKDPNDKFDNGPQTTNISNTAIGLGNTEALVLSFSSSVVLTAISINDKSGDADVSLLRWVGADAPSIVGSLAAVGVGRWTAADLQAALEAKDRSALAENAPPEGLYFVRALYP